MSADPVSPELTPNIYASDQEPRWCPGCGNYSVLTQVKKVLAKLGSKTMLLTGDARGDHILEGLREDGFLTGRSMKVNIMKVPHHGSDRNVDSEFFRTVKADHYVISGNGKHGDQRAQEEHRSFPG